jgi:hypothetical protein
MTQKTLLKSRNCTIAGVSATHHCGHQRAAENDLISVTILHLKSLMAFFQVVHNTDCQQK